MTSFYFYYNVNPSGVCFLVQIRAFLIFKSLSGINKFKYGRENEINSGLSTVKIRQHGNGLFMTLLWFQKTQECE